MARGAWLALAALGPVAVAACSSFAADPAPGEDAGATSDAGAIDGTSGSDAVSGADVVSLDAATDGGPTLAVGCADGTREAFTDLATYPKIAGCDGAWSIPGMGNDVGGGCNHAPFDAYGTNCRALDVCAIGWHVCTDHLEVATHGVSACPVDPAHLYATAQRSDNNGSCAVTLTGANDVFGCGGPGGANSPSSNCAPLNGFVSIALGFGIWAFASASDSTERDTVIKGPGSGGVLCCSDL